MQPEMIDRSPAVAPKHAGGMCVVDHHDRAVPFGDFDQLRQRTDIAVHRKYAVSDQQLAARHVLQLFELRLGRGRIAMRERHGSSLSTSGSRR